MPKANVTILEGTSKRLPNGRDLWTFEVIVNGHAGLVTRNFPGGTPKEDVVAALKDLLESHPGELEGIVSTDPGNTGEPDTTEYGGVDSGEVDGGGGDEDDDIPVTLESTPEQ